ncbi:nuclear transport factor 2 family protein [Actinoplanes subglobosus]|uniref:Nuclear transport factor 2 family protein n=1 Tax=Actinoplanes subglobosus TaxID=1547892 RepID=A0ABV8J1C3_9ACTN
MTAGAGYEGEIIDAYRAMYRGMLERDTALLDDLLAEDYTLTHMTGYVQPKREWLQQIDSGRMQYHCARPHSVTTQIDGDSAELVGREVVDATIWGGRGTWNLQLSTTYERRDDAWIAVRTVATTF